MSFRQRRKRMIWSNRGRGARRNARCFFLLIAPLHLPQAARCSEPWHAPRPIFKAFNLNKKWNRSLRSRWNNLLCKLWYLPLRIKWNEINPHRRSDFTRRRRISRPQGISQIPKGIYFVEKKALANASAFFMSMGYEKDIFGSFAYDFELSQKLIFG